MIKIDTDFNLNVKLKLFFSLSKKIIFSSLILANNNLLLKTYCEYENIVITFLSFFLFFPPLFFYSTHVPLLFSFFPTFLSFSIPLPPSTRTFHKALLFFFSSARFFPSIPSKHTNLKVTHTTPHHLIIIKRR